MAINVSMFLISRCHPGNVETRGYCEYFASVQGPLRKTMLRAYSTSKSAIIGLTRTIAVDYAREQI